MSASAGDDLRDGADAEIGQRGEIVPLASVAVDARLPAAYESARQALEACERIDECQDWADKHAALASYARQAKDKTLERYCARIKARAIRREGELLKQAPDASRLGLNQHNEAQVGDLPRLTRTTLADAAGLSEHQRKQAIRVASVPIEDFERQVESERPPTLTELAAQGTQSRPQPHQALGERGPQAGISTSPASAVEASSDSRPAQSWVQRVLAIHIAIGQGDIPRPEECRTKLTPADLVKLRGALPAIIRHLEQVRVAICPRCGGEGGCVYCGSSMERRH